MVSFYEAYSSETFTHLVKSLHLERIVQVPIAQLPERLRPQIVQAATAQNGDDIFVQAATAQIGTSIPAILTLTSFTNHIEILNRCFVLIDIKRGAVKHKDIGQMNMYLGYFAKDENVEGDNPPIGIIMSHYKDELMVEYATYGTQAIG